MPAKLSAQNETTQICVTDAHSGIGEVYDTWIRMDI
jgi:hypothetical protein